jgi:hypothetical protein
MTGLSRAWREALAILLAAAAVWVLFDALLFRTRLYTRILDPNSSTGLFELTLSNEAAGEYRAKGVLICGSSLMAEGFSAKVANSPELARGYQFSNAAVAGTAERCWYYLLRDLDPGRNRYAAIVIGLESYDDRDRHELDPADRIADLHFLAVRLRLFDVPEFAGSFRSPGLRLEAARGALLKGLVYRQDLHAFLAAPGQRLADVREQRERANSDFYNYPGADRSLAGLSVDWNARTITFPDGLTPAEKEQIRKSFFAPAPPQRGYLGEYRRVWLRRIADLYQGAATRILFARPPSTPLARPDEPLPTSRSAVRELASRPGVMLSTRSTSSSGLSSFLTRIT